MSTSHGAYRTSDSVKLLVLILAVTALFAAAFVSVSDQSSADSVPSKTYYYDDLNEVEKKIVDGLPDFTAEKTLDKGLVTTYQVDLTAELAGKTAEQASSYITDDASYRMLVSIAHDMPQYFWINALDGMNVNGSMTSDGDGKIVSFTATVKFENCLEDYGVTTEELKSKMAELQTTAANVTLENTSTPYYTVKSIHDYVCKTLTYDETKADGVMNRNAYTALLGSHSVVCEGYAKAFKLLCDAHDITAMIVTGDAGTTSPKEAHMWNQIYMSNGDWYHVDCTWDDQETPRDTYLLAGYTTKGFDDVLVSDTYSFEKKLTDHFTTIPEIGAGAYESYTIQFLDYDGTVLQSYTDKKTGDIISAPADPTYSDDSIGTFTFTGWSPSVQTTVTSNAVYTAQYSIVCLVQFKNYDGTMLQEASVPYGTTLTPPVPTRASDGIYTYNFIGWTPELVNPVVAKAVYTAQFESEVKVVAKESYTLTDEVKTALAGQDKFTVTLTNADDSVLAMISFDSAAISGLTSGQTLTVSKIDTSAVSESVRSSLEKATIYRIDFGSNNTSFSSGKATVSLYYVKNTLDNIGGINLYYVNGDTLESIPYAYEDNYVVFETSHFSDYAIKNSLGLDGFMWYIPIIAILILAFIGFALAYRFS